MKAPEKIYVYIPDDDIVGTASTQKGFPHQFVTEEYTRTDAFIEKVRGWLKDCATFTDMNGKTRMDEEMYKAAVEDFEKYMKGE